MGCLVFSSFLIISCQNDDGTTITSSDGNPVLDVSDIDAIFNGKIDLDNLYNYSNQSIPNYIDQDNTDGNHITNIGATLGRVL